MRSLRQSWRLRPESGRNVGVDRKILDSLAVKRLKTRLNALLDDYLLHDGWGHLEMDMKILSRHQKEVVIRAGREYRFVVDFQNAPAIGPAAQSQDVAPLGKGNAT